MPTARIQGNLRSAVSKTIKTINQTQKIPNPKISKRCTRRLNNLMILHGLVESPSSQQLSWERAGPAEDNTPALLSEQIARLEVLENFTNTWGQAHIGRR